MKRFLIGTCLLFSFGIVFAQTPEDALRYSWLTGGGTARSQSIGNANGAIGGEISTIFSNPANIGFYKTGDFVITGGLNLNNNKSTYLGGNATGVTNSSGFLGTSGFVLGKESYGKGSLKSSAFGLAINRTADFNNRISYQNKVSSGSALSRTSMANMFIEDIQAQRGLNDYGSGLAYETFWVDTNAAGQLYSSASALAAASGLEQKQEIITSGGITEFSFAGAANLNDRFYIGGAIGIPILRYGASRRYTEQDPTDNASNQFDVAYFDDDLVTRGMGINVKAGIVVKATDNLRVGFSAHSPTFYALSDTYTAEAGASVENYPTGTANNSFEAKTNDPLVFDYNLQTPYRLGASFALMFGNVNDVTTQRGFLSGDVEYVNYMASTFRTTRNDNGNIVYENTYTGLNNAIDDAYKGAVNARLGTELKFNTLMVRLGGAYYGNPYNDVAGEKGRVIQATGGLGYRNRGFFVDLGYVHSFVDDVVFPYRLTGAAFNPAYIKGNNSRVLLTLGFKL